MDEFKKKADALSVAIQHDIRQNKLKAASEQLDMPVKQLPDGAIGFTCREVVGMEVWKTGTPEKLLKNKDDLQEGDHISTTGLLGEELRMVVKSDGGSLYGEVGRMISILEFDQDERHCWVSVGLINRRALEKLTKTTVVE